MKNNIYIYGLYKKKSEKKNISDGLFYIGITDNIHRRKLNHKNNEYEFSKSNNILKKRIIDKYDFDIEIFWITTDRKEALDRETFLIKWFGSLYDNSGILTNIKYQGSNTYLGSSKFTNEKKKEIVDNWIVSKESALNYSKKIGINYTTLINWGNKFYTKNELPILHKDNDIDIDTIKSILDSYDEVCLIENKTQFAKKNNINPHRFTEWVNKYRKDIIKKQLDYENERLLKIYNEYKKYKGTITSFIRKYKTSLIVLKKVIKKYDKYS